MADGAENFGFLAHKVGPFQVWVWGLMAVGGYYWYTHYGPGASSSAAAQPVQVQQDQITTQPTYGGSQYKTNAEWLDAAINYLVSESVPPDEASAALYNYLHSKVLTTQEQKDVNLAIEGIGPPPNIPAPAVVTPKPKPKPKPKKSEEAAEPALVRQREKHVGEYGSPAYRKRYGKTWKRK